MQNLMPLVNTPDNLFHDGNPVTGELGTIVEAEHLNNEQSAIRDVQSEMISVLAAAGIEVDPDKQDQLLTAMKAILLSRVNPFADIAADGPEAIATALANLGLGELAATPRFLVTKGSNSRGWYEIYSDGFIRQGMKFTNDSPLTISSPSAGAVVAFPTSFNSTINGVSLAVNAGIDNGMEYPGFTSESLSSIKILTMSVSNANPASGYYVAKFVGYIVVEGF